MIEVTRTIRLNPEDISLSAIRAQGNGGQHVNKASTAVHLRFDIRASQLAEDVQQKLLRVNHHLITAEGVVVIKSQSFRSQDKNRSAAIERLVALIRELTYEEPPRKATRPTRASKLRRLQSKSRQSATKSLRGKVRGTE